MTEAPADILPLAADFPSATRAQWLELVARLLKGAPFERRLVAKTYDGLTIQPLYDESAPGHAPVGRMPGTGWQILQRVDHPDPAAANTQARHDRDNGASGLSLVIAGAVGAYGYGVAADETAIARTLDGIALDAAGMAIELDAGACSAEAARSIAALTRRCGVPAGAAHIRFGFDPLGDLAMGGAAPAGWNDAAARFGRQIAELAGAGFKGPFAVADARAIHNAGGSRHRSSASRSRPPSPICGRSRAAASRSVKPAA
jgi:methylmalonyl-CoA mutase